VAADPDGDLSEVYVNLNNTGWEIATGTDAWTKDLVFTIGENTVMAKSIDAQGLESELIEVHVLLSIQIITLSPGWSVISSYLEPVNPELDIIMDDVGIPGNLTIMLSEFGIYWPDHNVNSLGTWNFYEGYKVKFIQADELIFRGDMLNGNTVTFGAGFHYIPVLSNVNAPVSEIFADPENDIIFLFDLTTQEVYWPLGGIMDLTELIPGMGYFANFNKEVTIDFPDYSILKSGNVTGVPDAQNNGPWEYSRSGNVHLMSIDHEAAAMLKDVSHIGAFDENGYCIGSVELNQADGNYLLSIFADDETTPAKDGAIEGEFLTFRAFNSQQNIEYEVIPEFSNKMPDVSGEFKTNGMSMIINFKESSTGIGNETFNGLQIQLFPNPARDEVTLTCPQYTSDAVFEAEFINAGGKLAKKIELGGKSTSIDLDDINPGVYFVKITSENGTVIKKLVIQ